MGVVIPRAVDDVRTQRLESRFLGLFPLGKRPGPLFFSSFTSPSLVQDVQHRDPLESMGSASDLILRFTQFLFAVQDHHEVN